VLYLPNGDIYKPTTNDAPAGEKKPNRLINETSPYLLQHAHNPVDWYPWGQEAVDKARAEHKPLLISIGYSACHWCHVMERECFENPEIAKLVNDTVVAVKVDREERPDVDAIYMQACTAMNGHGGWPLNAFVTQELRPFFVGTYFPPTNRGQLPGFPQVLQRIAEVWNTDRIAITTQARMLHEGFVRTQQSGDPQDLEEGLLQRFVDDHARTYDPVRGGFGRAPKFPPDTRSSVLLGAHHTLQSEKALEMATGTLTAMARGGLFDHVGGGFARYSVDAEWLIPHFEKMLYNQALLVPVYSDAWLVTGNELYRRTVRETLDWCATDLRSPEDAYYCALDADSEGEEGKYYVWTPGQVQEALGSTADAAYFCRAYGITGEGNFEHGTSNPNLVLDEEQLAKAEGGTAAEHRARLDGLRAKLLEVRRTRIAPGLDDKCLTGWNGLMITALCRAWQVFGEDRDLESARQAAHFFLSPTMLDGTTGRLHRVWCKGRATVDGVLEDYAYLLAGLLDLFECDGSEVWISQAIRLAEVILADFEDQEIGGFFSVRDGDTLLVSRPRDDQDGALPAAGAVAAQGLARLWHLTGREDFRLSAERAIRSEAPKANRFPAAFASVIHAGRILDAKTPVICVHGGGDGNGDGSAGKELFRAATRTYLPVRVILQADQPGAVGLFAAEGRTNAEKPTAHVCFANTCQQPVHRAEELVELLKGIR
jgi:uncharacterized protein YyaL (SSP411 family)